MPGEVGRIVRFGLEHSAVFGINFQPAFHAGRHGEHSPMQRMTNPDLLNLIEIQTADLFKVSDFVPVPYGPLDIQPKKSHEMMQRDFAP